MHHARCWPKSIDWREKTQSNTTYTRRQSRRRRHTMPLPYSYIQKLIGEPIQQNNDRAVADAAVRYTKGQGNLPPQSSDELEAVLDRMAAEVQKKAPSLSTADAMTLVLKSEAGRALYDASIAAQHREAVA